MKNHILSEINFSKLKELKGKTLDKTFEYLSANFLQYNLGLSIRPIVSDISNFPGIEGPPFDFCGKQCGFQSKFGDNAFNDSGFKKSFKTIKESIKKGKYKLKVLYLFSVKDEPLSKKWKEDITDFELETGIEVITSFLGNRLIGEITQEKYWELLHKYFGADDDIKREVIRKSLDKQNCCSSLLQKDIDNVKNGFEGDITFYKNDLEYAKLKQKKYSTRKLTCATFLQTSLNEIEDEVYDNFSDELRFIIYNSIHDYTRRFEDKIKSSNRLKDYEIELNNLIDCKESMIINYGTKGYCKLNYKAKNNIQFKNIK